MARKSRTCSVLARYGPSPGDGDGSLVAGSVVLHLMLLGRSSQLAGCTHCGSGAGPDRPERGSGSGRCGRFFGAGPLSPLQQTLGAAEAVAQGVAQPAHPQLLGWFTVGWNASGRS